MCASEAGKLLAAGVNWGALSDEALWTVSRIAIPVACGLSQREVARSLGLKASFVAKRLAELRAELRDQLEAGS